MLFMIFLLKLLFFYYDSIFFNKINLKKIKYKNLYSEISQKTQ